MDETRRRIEARPRFVGEVKFGAAERRMEMDSRAEPGHEVTGTLEVTIQRSGGVQL